VDALSPQEVGIEALGSPSSVPESQAYDHHKIQ
jgi:hypothetical protein